MPESGTAPRHHSSLTYPMAKRKTTLEKIAALRAKAKVISDKIVALMDACPHSIIRCERRTVGFNGYGHDIETTCRCQLCEKSWWHDGYCTGTGHSKDGKGMVLA